MNRPSTKTGKVWQCKDESVPAESVPTVFHCEFVCALYRIRGDIAAEKIERWGSLYLQDSDIATINGNRRGRRANKMLRNIAGFT